MRHKFFSSLPSLRSQSYMTAGQTKALTICTIVGRVISLHFNTLSRFVIAFLPRSNHLLISWLQSPSGVILEPKRKFVTTSTISPSICHEVMGLNVMVLIFFLVFNFKLALSLSSFTLIKRLFIPFCFCHYSGIIHISEIVDVYPTYLDSSL